MVAYGDGSADPKRHAEVPVLAALRLDHVEPVRHLAALLDGPRLRHAEDVDASLLDHLAEDRLSSDLSFAALLRIGALAEGPDIREREPDVDLVALLLDVVLRRAAGERPS